MIGVLNMTTYFVDYIKIFVLFIFNAESNNSINIITINIILKKTINLSKEIEKNDINT